MSLKIDAHMANKIDWETLFSLNIKAVAELKEIIEHIAQDYEERYSYNPIEHMKSRIKTKERTLEKLARKGFEVSCESAYRELCDIGGVRVVCSFIDDIYTIADRLSKICSVVICKDYIKHPKENGYRSLHMILKVPVKHNGAKVGVRVELQLRTVAMDFWASSEHRIFYKSGKEIPEDIYNELKTCAEITKMLDDKMQSMRRIAGALELFGDEHCEQIV